MNDLALKLKGFDLLLNICRRPGLFLGRATYASLFDFIRGYSFACQENGIDDPFHSLADLIFGKYLAYHPAISPEDVLAHYFEDGDVSAIEKLISEYEFLVKEDGFRCLANWRDSRIRNHYGAEFGAPEDLLAEALRRKMS